MGKSKDIDGSASVPAFYGAELRWRREAAGLTLRQAVAGSYYGVSYLSEIERGNRRIPLDLAQHLDRILGTDGFFTRRCEDVRKARSDAVAPYFAEALELESRAEEVAEWSPMVLPGPLQLEPYIRELIRAAEPLAGEERTARLVAARRDRAWVYEDADGPASWVVIHESLLRQPIGGDEAMAEQLAHVAAVARRRRYIPQILPCNAGAHPFMMGSTHFMSFSDAPPVVYMESTYSGQMIDDPGVVVQYQKAYDRLRAFALPPEASLKMIEAAAEDYGSGNHARRLERGHLATAPPPWGTESRRAVG
ncbi:helix-turn-helix transcriptional regulator [Streptomyces sp. NBC_01298]|uniref:helix-turn-helix domain-containing protein n=1 Tax=Streptomyces sp. NBC_01298 TaxID=2903817 RepID=UPI002E11CD54|nr:helix-turn-helix transcriptional regulator [Streptomyces sp. NBC_01298]